jgi:alpha-galactosidase
MQKNSCATFYSLLVLTSLFLSFSASAQSISLKEGNMQFNFSLNKTKNLKLMSILPENYQLSNILPEVNAESNNEVFFHLTGENRTSHHGSKLTGGNPGGRLIYIEKKETKTDNGKQIVFIQKDTVYHLKVESYYEFFDQISVVRRYTRVLNEGNQNVDIEYLSSAVLHNFSEIMPGRPQDNLKLKYAFNSWQQEAQWKSSTPAELGWDNNNSFNLNGISFTNIGSWSTIKYLPMAMVENTKAGVIWFWQIEHNGSWHWEMSNTSNGSSYLYLGGPDAEHHQAMKVLKPGENYQTVPVAFGCVKGGFDEAVAALTQYRRKALCKVKPVDKNCPVIFNDYMNCLGGNPLTETELPLIRKAAQAGCNYFVIDAGWYAEKNETWWDAVGLWNPSKSRFEPYGLQSILDTIRAKGMVPGLWLEPEVAGINSPLKNKPDSWFLMRNGKRVIDNSRYLLDFRNKDVRNYMSSVVERLVKEYKVGYIKMDYNNTAWGAESVGVSVGQGLLEHNRAVAAWYKEISNRFPELIVENCGSGGCRMDYAMLSNTQLQSSSDQTDYRKYPAILVGALAAVVPEQLAVWSYPRKGCDINETSFNMVSSMLCRIHQSGNLSQLSAQNFNLVQEGLNIYKQLLAPIIPKSIPYFPLGLPSMQDSISPIALGMMSDKTNFLSVWRLAGKNEVIIPIKNKNLNLVYPKNLNIKSMAVDGGIKIIFPDKYMAAIFELQ